MEYQFFLFSEPQRALHPPVFFFSFLFAPFSFSYSLLNGLKIATAPDGSPKLPPNRRVEQRFKHPESLYFVFFFLFLLLFFFLKAKSFCVLTAKCFGSMLYAYAKRCKSRFAKNKSFFTICLQNWSTRGRLLDTRCIES